MTLEQLLAETPVDPRDPNSPWLVWFKAGLSKEEKKKYIAAAGTQPYASVSGLEENERSVSHDDVAFLDQLVVVNLYQPPETVVVGGEKLTRTPHDAQMYALYTHLWKCAKTVDAAGKNRHFLGLVRSQNNQPPVADPDTSGLAARPCRPGHFGLIGPAVVPTQVHKVSPRRTSCQKPFNPYPYSTTACILKSQAHQGCRRRHHAVGVEAVDTKLILKGRGVQLLLFGTEQAGDQLFAQGYQTDVYIRKNRILKDDAGSRYRVPVGVEPKEGAVQVVPKSLSAPLILEVLP